MQKNLMQMRASEEKSRKVEFRLFTEILKGSRFCADSKLSSKKLNDISTTNGELSSVSSVARWLLFMEDLNDKSQLKSLQLEQLASLVTQLNEIFDMSQTMLEINFHNRKIFH